MELLPQLKDRVLAARDPQSLWREVEREFRAAKACDDRAGAAACLKYAVWTLHPTPQAKTMSDVSGAAADLLYGYADDLHVWMTRYDFMRAQKGLRFHLGDQKHSEFEARFMEKTAGYPKEKRPNRRTRPTGTSGSARSELGAASTVGSRRQRLHIALPTLPMAAVVTRIPAERLVDERGDLGARRHRWLSKGAVREMLRQSPVEFLIADVGIPLRRIEVSKCYDFWKSEAEAHIVNDPDSGFRPEDFPNDYAYVASEWSGGIQTPIVLLEKHH